MEYQNHEEILHSNNNNNIVVPKTIIKTPNKKRLNLLLLNILLLIIGAVSNPLILRAYFLHGGDRKWFAGFLQNAAFPFLLIPILFSGHRRRLFSLTRPLFLYCTILGLMTGLDDYLYSLGISFLPVSTASLLISMQLGFTAISSFFIVKQKLTSFTVNAVVLLTFGAIVLGVHANSDRPDGESKYKYYFGFVITLSSAILCSLVLPLLELMMRGKEQEVTYALAMEMQFVIGFFSTVVCVVGMVIDSDFQAISSEGKHYELGETKYYLIVFFTTILAQFFVLGLVGTIKYSSALLSGVIIAVCIPITEVLAVFFFHEKFDGEKGVALALSLWGTTSYFYGEYKEHKKSKAIATVPVVLPVSIVS